MIGVQHVEVKNRQAQFKFDLHRNITVVTGDSGTGKTTLFEMISDFGRLGERSGVQVRCNKKCIALTDIDWRNQLAHTTDSIVFVDEGADYINGPEFAAAVRDSDNYYVLFYRENLHELPYSADEIYEIKISGKFHLFKKKYSSKNHIYAQNASSGTQCHYQKSHLNPYYLIPANMKKIVSEIDSINMVDGVWGSPARQGKTMVCTSVDNMKSAEV